MSVRKGEAWERPFAGEPDLCISGSDAELVDALARREWSPEAQPALVVEYRPAPNSDLGRVLGSTAIGPEGRHTVALDVLRVSLDAEPERMAVGSVVIGATPTRLGRRHRSFRVTISIEGRAAHTADHASVVVTNAQFVGGGDLAPRGHPGDGRFEIVSIGVSRRQRRTFRARLATGTHVPHPDVSIVPGRACVIEVTPPQRIAVDGRPEPRGVKRARLRIELAPGVLQLLV